MTRAGTTEASQEAEKQKGFMSAAKKSTSAALSNVASLWEPVTVSGRHEVELVANDSASYGQITRPTAELSETRKTIST